MGNGQSKQKITAQDRAILDMKIQRDKIHQYQRRIQIILDREHEIAMECLRRGQKEKARTALRRRKYQESLLSQADKQLETLEQLVSSVEFALMEKDVVYGLKQGNAALKEIHKELVLEDVEKLMDETAEAIAYQKEIDNVLAGRLTNDDEDEVEAELARMEAEERAKNAPAVETPALPDAPTADPVPKAETLEEIKERRARERAEERRRRLKQAAEEEEDDTREMIPA